MSSIPTGTVFPSVPEILPWQALREKDPSGTDADQDQILHALVLFQNLIGDARQGAVDSLRVHDDFFLHHGVPHEVIG